MPSKLDIFLDGGIVNGREIAGRKVTEKDKPFTLWSFLNKDKWFITDDDLSTFYKLYCDDIRNGIPRYLTEKSTAVGQLRVDLDFKYEGQVEDHKHTQEQVVAFVGAYMTEVKKYLNVPETVEVIVLEKDYPTYDSVKKISNSGIHIQVPDVKSRAGVEQAIRLALLPRMETFFPGLGLTKPWSDVYDKQPLSHTNNWPLLGSKKPVEGSLPYQIKYILDWDAETGDISVDDTVPPTTVDIVRRLSVRSHESEETPMTPWGKENSHQVSEQVVVVQRSVSAARGRSATRADEHGSRGSSPGRIYVQPLTIEFRKYVGDHVKNLSENRYNNYSDWISVGQCLKNIHPDLNDEWHEFSSKYPSYSYKEAEAKWNSFSFRVEGAKLSIGSLRHWSAMDNFEGFKKAEEENIDAWIEKSAETATENDVAHVVFAKYRDEFKCAKFGANEWYRYTGHIWKTTDRGVALQQRLSKDIADIYLRKENEQTTQLLDMDTCPHSKDPDPTCERCKAEAKKKSYSNIRLKLKRTGFKESVMKECRELFLDEELSLKLDENKHLIAFNNGVFDTLNMEFRAGRAEDYISFCTNIDFLVDKKHYECECWPEIDKFLRSILPNQRVREYFLRHMATCLSGGNEAQKFHILTGSGSNGKSMITNLMSTAMGDYTCKAPISLLTQQRGKSANAAPELVRMKGRRFVTMQEPDEQVPLNTGLMKELASCEKITARDLYAGSKQMIDFEIQARFHLACNDKPKVNSTDGGTWRRLVVIDFPMKFVAEPTLPNELPVDETIIKKVVSEEWATCYMAYLVHLYKEGNGFHKLTPPEEVMAYTNEYKEESDVIARFLREFVHPVTDANVEPATWQAITTSFQDWKRTNEIVGRGTATELRKRLEGLYGKYPRNGWTAFQFGNA